MSEKKPVIDLQPRILLTDSGAGFFMDKGYKLHRISMADGAKQYGVRPTRISPTSFQHLVRLDYLSGLEITRPEFSSVRSDLMDFSKLIVFGMLYRQFDQSLFDMLIGSSMIKDWNRSNPGNIIDEQTQINDDYLHDVLAQNADQLRNIRHAITGPLKEKTANDASLQGDEKNTAIFLSDRFLEHTRPFIWFILTRFSTYSEHKDLIENTRTSLEFYIRRSRIADYLTLLLMELVISAESLNLTSYAEAVYGANNNIEARLHNAGNRKKLFQDMVGAGKNFTIAWRIGSSTTRIGTGVRMEVTLYNEEAEYLELKEKMDERMKNGSTFSLSEFYREGTTDNAEMGLLYLGYLQEECDKVGMRLNSRVGESRGGVPSITLTLQF